MLLILLHFLRALPLPVPLPVSVSMPVPVYFYLLLPLLEDDLRDGVLGGVREREVRVGCAQRDEEFACVAGELKERRAGVGRGDFDVMP